MLEHFAEKADAYGLSLLEYADRIVKDEINIADLVEDLKESIEGLIMFTSFFDFDVDEVKRFIHRLIEEKIEAKDFSLVIKDVACCTGMETYSISAIIYGELSNYAHRLGQNPEEWIEKWEVVIKAYDISMPALINVKRGIYTEESVIPLDKELIRKISIQLDDGRFQIIPEVRAWVKPIYVGLNDNFQFTRIARLNHELVFFLFPEGVVQEQQEAIINLLRHAFTARYPGLFIYSSLEGDDNYESINPES
jgi:chemotaxis methyl-accepting protein methylase